MKKRLILFSSAVVFAIAVVLNVVFYHTYQKEFQTRLEESYMQMAQRNSDNVKYEIERYNMLLENIAINEKISTVLQDYEVNLWTRAGMIDSELSDVVGVSKLGEKSMITIYPEDENYECYSRYIRNVRDVEDEEWYIVNKNEKKNIFFEEIIGTKYLVLAMPIYKSTGGYYFSRERVATIKMRIDLEELFKSMGNICDVYVVDAKDGCRYATDGSEDIKQDVIGKLMNRDIVHISQRIYTKQRFLSDELSIIYAFDVSGLLKLYQKNILMTILISVTVLLIALALLFHYMEKIIIKIDFILNKVSKVGAGEWKSDEKLIGSDELARIDDSIDAVIGKIDRLIYERYMSEIETKNAQLKALQMQINPHFLYNTLNTINKMAIVNGCEDICVISQKLGDMFKYNMSVGSDVTVELEDEIVHVMNYIDIQNIRFGNSIDMYIDIPEELKKCKVLKFIMQPIVENSIKYGMKNNSSQLGLSIDAHDDNGDLFITLQDDGAGMTENALFDLKRGIDDNSISGHIGLENIHNRLKIMYGSKYGMRVESKEGIGTRVTLTLPKIYGGEN